jgi:hypothetical protein
MQRLVYISTARQILAPSELDGLLVQSRRNNAAVGVTGLLVVGGRRFIQALEGPAEAVGAVFRRIEQDPRHFAVVVLANQSIEMPTFGNWAMGYCRGGDPEGPSLAKTVSRLVAPIGDAIIRAHFEGFAQIHTAGTQ